MGRGFQVWKFHLKISPWEKKPCLPRAYGPWEASFSSCWLIFGGEEISIPETWPIRKSYIFPTIHHFFYGGSQNFQIFGIKCLSFGKIPTYHQDLWGMSANVNNLLHSSFFHKL